MRLVTQIPQRGDFAYQCMVGPQKVSGAQLADLRDHFGLKLTKHMPFGSVRDEEGHIYSMVRALNAPGSTPNPTKFIYQSTRLDGQNLRIDKERIAPRALTMFPARGLDGDTAWWSSLPEDSGAAWRISASGSDFHWHEDGLFDLKGHLLGHGMQWYLPGVDWGTFYVAQMYAVQGTCEGRPVQGVISLDQAWLAEGGAIHMHKDLVVNNKMHVIWWNFATVYEDGSYDVGSILVGHENLGYAILQNEQGEVRTSTRIEGIARHADGSWFAADAHVTIDGSEQWEFLPDPKGRMVDFVGGFPITAQQEGRWRRVGDTRVPKLWMAWGETDRRNGSARNVRGHEL